MSMDPAVLLKEALELPADARAALAGSLLESLEPEVDSSAEAAWQVEIRRRVKELDSGTVEPLSWAEARRRIAGE